jgi:uncharacterized protein (DUF362 family)
MKKNADKTGINAKFNVLPAKLQKIYNRISGFSLPAKVTYIIISLLATIWFLFRVLPKPSRAAYPCMQVAAPIMSSFVIWLISITGSWYFLKKGIGRIASTHYLGGISFLLVSLMLGLLSTTQDTRLAVAGENVTTCYQPNQPVGEAYGINPGRVVWSRSPGAATWDGKNGSWWEDRFNDQDKINTLFGSSLLQLTNATSEKKAWDLLFKHFNKTKRNTLQGYQAGEKIAIKINQNNTYSHKNSEEINTSPQLVLAALKSIIEKGGVPQKDITVFDASRFITDNIYDKCHAVFPDVIFVDHTGGEGRVKANYVSDAIPYSVDNGELARGLAVCAVDADYLINIAVLKGHVGQGVTLCAKNYYGVTSIHADWRKNAHNNFEQDRSGKPKYITFVDFMGHKDLGAKTMLFVVDDLYSNKFVNGKPEYKWEMPPFNKAWPSSLFVSQDMVAIDAVCCDFIINEWPDAPDLQYCDAYLIEAAQANDSPSKTAYDPERDGTTLQSLGVMEHWNNAEMKQYSRNLETGNGIELVYKVMN